MKVSFPIQLMKEHFFLITLFSILSSCQQVKESSKALSEATEKPNILLVMVDDMGWTDIGLMAVK